MPILNLHGKARRDAVAVVTGNGQHLTYPDLYRMVTGSRQLFEHARKALVAIFCAQGPYTDSVIAYLACLFHQHACGFFGDLPQPAENSLIDAYQPEFVVRAGPASGASRPSQEHYAAAGQLPGGAVVYRRKAPSEGAIYPDLALLLATSGSMGSPKVVRLSRANLEANAVSIATALGIGEADCAVLSLPLSHCYGLSVLNSHLAAGASVAVCTDRVLSARFWRSVASNGVTSFAGVPAVYELLHARRFDPAAYPSLTTMTQAGGRLPGDLVRHFGDLMEREHGRFWVMYGQTEATARITCLPPADLTTRPASVGRVVPGGRLHIEDPAGAPVPDGQTGAIIYRGPNVMLGYAASRADLAQGDVLGGRLATGDLGYLLDGYLYLTGRTRRVAKILGYRVELDQVETAFATCGPAKAVTGGAGNIVVFAESVRERHERIRLRLCRQLGLPPAALTVREVEVIPLTRTGKTDYGALAALAATPRPAREADFP